MYISMNQYQEVSLRRRSNSGIKNKFLKDWFAYSTPTRRKTNFFWISL